MRRMDREDDEPWGRRAVSRMSREEDGPWGGCAVERMSLEALGAVSSASGWFRNQGEWLQGSGFKCRERLEECF